MFRTQQNAFDDLVAKATDENLTSENWEFILDVCDKVGASDSGSKDVVAAMIKRLAHRNANVQLYTLELANSLSQNCGVALHRELASRSFTDAMLRLAADRTTHQAVKSKILERMEEWTTMFSKNTELGIMGQAYQRLKSQNPNLQPPQAPTKRMITQYDKQKEEEELQMALRLSVQENKAPSKPAAAELPGQSTIPTSSPQLQTVQPQPVPTGTTAATVSRVRALFDFVPSEPGELAFRKSDVIAVLESVYKDWWKGSLRGQTGIFPLNYVEKLTDPTPDEIQRAAQMEAEVFGQIKNVERLLALLSTNAGDSGARDNEELTDLYQSALSIRPKLIELIGKYTQKKDDLQQLNEKFIKARRDYEALLETSMAHSAQQYGRPGPQQPYGYGGGYPAQGYPPPQRFYPNDIQQPNTGAPPPQQYPQASTQSFQPPYPSATPVPQSHTPAPGYPSATPVPQSHTPAPGYPPQLGRRQSYHSDHVQAPSQYPPQHPQDSTTLPYDGPADAQYPQRQSSYPPPAVTNVQTQDGKDYYSASVYSQESGYPPSISDQPPRAPTANSYQAPPTQSTQGYPPPQPSYVTPPQPSHGPPQAPPDRQDAVTPYPSYPPSSTTQQSQGQPPPQQQYQAYQPPQVAGAGGPGNYYR